MSSGEEQIVKSILQDFIGDSVPEYILESAKDVVASNGVSKLDLKKRDQYWDIDGSVQGDDFQNYTSEIGLNLSEQSINYYCNCPEERFRTIVLRSPVAFGPVAIGFAVALADVLYSPANLFLSRWTSSLQ